ncbi:hypothetical protein ILYODFUR_008326 [Ilyodon furcidens]|uniref:Uncharacterized protein n=1 Tax=Ilyodon furcidens TaxID=33524 RepID=A0ABV0UEU3_9TELE
MLCRETSRLNHSCHDGGEIDSRSATEGKETQTGCVRFRQGKKKLWTEGPGGISGLGQGHSKRGLRGSVC